MFRITLHQAYHVIDESYSQRWMERSKMTTAQRIYN